MDDVGLDVDTMYDVELIRHRSHVKRDVQSCTACGLRCGMDKGGWLPVPALHPPISARGADGVWGVVGEAPGPEEARRGAPFVGKSGKLFKAMCSRAGLDWELGSRMNTVSCFPHEGKGKGITIRQPSESEMRSCRHNLMAQLSTLSTPYVILAGSHAVKSWRNDLRVGEVKDRVFTWELPFGKFYVFPILHPAAVLRQRILWDSSIINLRWIADIVKGVADVSDYINYTCIVCGSASSELDPDMVPYCTRHWARYGGAWKLARDYWADVKYTRGKGGRKKVVIEGQGNLL